MTSDTRSTAGRRAAPITAAEQRRRLVLVAVDPRAGASEAGLRRFRLARMRTDGEGPACGRGGPPRQR